MAGKPPENGTTGLTTVANVRRLREDLGLNYTQLSERLDALGWPVRPTTVRRIEDGLRRMSVDDLVAFAVALEVTPITLLMPPDVTEPDRVELTGLSGEAFTVWEWLTGKLPRPGARLLRLLTWPSWVQDQVLLNVAQGHATGFRNDGREAVGSARVDAVDYQPERVE